MHTYVCVCHCVCVCFDFSLYVILIVKYFFIHFDEKQWKTTTLVLNNGVVGQLLQMQRIINSFIKCVINSFIKCELIKSVSHELFRMCLSNSFVLEFIML